MTNHNAPIAIFAYNRPDHLRACIASLRENAEAERSDLLIFCDGPKSENQLPLIEQVRAIAAQATGFASITAIIRNENFGLARSVVTGVTETLAKYDRVIVVEDDLVLSPAFLKFMNDGLVLYANEPRVASVQGYCCPVERPSASPFFLKGADCLGWATWRRAWKEFETDSLVLLEQLQRLKLEKAFNLDGAYPYSAMLRAQARGEISSWAVRWHASAFVKEMVSLYPGESLVLHAGDDEQATHSQHTSWLNGTIRMTPVTVTSQPVEEDIIARAALIRFYRANRRLSWKRVAPYLKRRLGKLTAR